ncbi:hypothetical protein [Bradyrhizobium sp.]|uniref:hypothetical protein n=1 Tax=Bradyrhizobium sp. TaxID=376 RepID=UPI0039E51E1B
MEQREPVALGVPLIEDEAVVLDQEGRCVSEDPCAGVDANQECRSEGDISCWNRVEQPRGLRFGAGYRDRRSPVAIWLAPLGRSKFGPARTVMKIAR